MKIPVDGHVHFHRPDLVEATLDAAARNFRSVAGGESGCLGVLLLNEAPGERVFSVLREQPRQGSWRVEPCTAEVQSLVCHGADGWMLVICGRQIPCERGLEVAALGTTEEFPPGAPFEETLARVLASGALTVLPWGFGKWVGARGKLVRMALDRHEPRAMAVGDNGGRLGLLGQPVLVRAAGKRGYRIIPGSDPFPFGNDYRRVGAFGFLVDEVPDSDAPWADLSRWLASGSLASYGQALGPVRFMLNQAGMQIYNFNKRRKAAA